MTPEFISDQLEKDILSGTYSPGSLLLQGELADRFGVSRIPIRDALARLASTGLIKVAPNRRARVTQLNRAEIREAYDLRILLECDLLARAILLMTPRELADVDYALERSSLEARSDNWAEGDALFHNALYAPADRPRHAAIVRKLRRTCRVQIAAYPHLTGKTLRWLADHATLSEYCHTGNISGAIKQLESHLVAVRDALLDVMPE